MPIACAHTSTILPDIQPRGAGCEECLATNGTWVHLRLCLTCGHVGCCDDSPRRHAREHAAQIGHVVMQSFEEGEEWVYCFEDGAFWETLDEVPR